MHDDIKLENILAQASSREDEYDHVKICDFGLSQVLDPQTAKAKPEVKCGTMGYMAPEIH